MNVKMLGVFAAGVVAASGVAYFLSNRGSAEASRAPEPVTVTVPAPVSPAPVEPVPAPAPVKVVKQKAAVKPLAPPAPVQRPEPPQPALQPLVANVALAPPPPPPPAPEPPPAPLAPAAPEPPHSVIITSGTLISARLNEGLSTKLNKAGDEFSATLDQPLVVDGFVIAERGARVDGRVAESDQAGRVKGLAHLAIELTQIHTADGQRIAIRTARFEKNGPESKGADVTKIGIGTALGAIIGAAAGGGKGAAIGAGAGGAAGAGTVVATRGKPAELPVETRISFRIDQPVTITEARR